jgi:hypothetical protein
LSSKKLFISYSHEDEKYKDKLIKHLSGLKNNKLIDIWNDRNIPAGDKWDEKINEELTNSDIVVFLISPDFSASEYINEKEIKDTMERHKNGEAYIVPILLRPCDFTSSILSSFQSVPRDLKFIVSSSFSSDDEGFLTVVQELKKIIKEFNPNRTHAPPHDDSSEEDTKNKNCCTEDYEISMSVKILNAINDHIEKNGCNKCNRGKYDDIEKALKIKFPNEKDIRIAINYLTKEKCIYFSYTKDRYNYDVEHISVTLEGQKTLRRTNR